LSDSGESTVFDNDESPADISDIAIGSGISEAEQREILEGIEQIAARNRESLSRDKPAVFKAKRRGGLLPLLVNLVALLLLAGAALVLYFRHDREEEALRRGNVAYTSAERALIQEIRRETAREIEEKEQQISLISSKLAGVDAELKELHSSNQELTVEQLAIEANLQRLQDEYRSSLSSLQDERSRLLEASRAREAGLRAQLEAQTQELTSVNEQSREALSAARAELERLSGDQEKGAAIEAHLGGLYTDAAAQVNAGRLEAALGTLATMREFINTPSFQNVRSIQARKNFYLSSIDTLEGVIAIAEKLNAVVAASEAGEQERAIAELAEKNAVLEEQVAGLNRAASGTQSSLSRQLTELQNRISGLQTQVSSQQRSISEKDTNITDLNTRNSTLTQQVSGLNQQLGSLTQERETLTQQVSGLNQQRETLNQQLSGLTQQRDTLNQQLGSLNQTVAQRETTIEGLRTESAERAAEIERLNGQLTNIRQTLQTLTE
jgi:chromosome segregation ATPase